MERIKGVNSFSTPDQKREFLEIRLELEKLRCEIKGFEPGDCTLLNTIYNEKEDKLYLIDFAAWRKRK